jgi:hypothetical protein
MAHVVSLAANVEHVEAPLFVSTVPSCGFLQDLDPILHRGFCLARPSSDKNPEKSSREKKLEERKNDEGRWSSFAPATK